jgi:hypothetical protein
MNAFGGCRSSSHRLRSGTATPPSCSAWRLWWLCSGGIALQSARRSRTSLQRALPPDVVVVACTAFFSVSSVGSGSAQLIPPPSPALVARFGPLRPVGFLRVRGTHRVHVRVQTIRSTAATRNGDANGGAVGSRGADHEDAGAGLGGAGQAAGAAAAVAAAAAAAGPVSQAVSALVWRLGELLASLEHLIENDFTEAAARFRHQLRRCMSKVVNARVRTCVQACALPVGTSPPRSACACCVWRAYAFRSKERTSSIDLLGLRSCPPMALRNKELALHEGLASFLDNVLRSTLQVKNNRRTVDGVCAIFLARKSLDTSVRPAERCGLIMRPAARLLLRASLHGMKVAVRSGRRGCDGSCETPGAGAARRQGARVPRRQGPLPAGLHQAPPAAAAVRAGRVRACMPALRWLVRTCGVHALCRCPAGATNQAVLLAVVVALRRVPALCRCPAAGRVVCCCCVPRVTVPACFSLGSIRYDVYANMELERTFLHMLQEVRASPVPAQSRVCS